MLTAAACLAIAMHHEARGETLEGQLWVAAVVLNRADGDEGEICRVVAAPKQFTDIDLTAPPAPDFEAQAELILNGELRLPDTGADHFHHVDITPHWAVGMQPVAVVGDHVFYDLGR